ncbi:hypothetical protein EV646_114187 [Kribbella antiqua]|uniref:Uncharacterized protein n=1 Tax=Kribbella antiqua TaxID=2512217 RepID=A0A4R2ICR1_9ACTN|nr:hypothetical protein EV646_114187 [Kribbella antiqua]
MPVDRERPRASLCRLTPAKDDAVYDASGMSGR